MVGFVSSALVMFGFIYALTKNKWLAWLAGFAVSFSPYYQMKVGGHPGYGYQALLIGAAWLFFNLIKHQKKRYAVSLGLVSALCFYFDPYFSLLLVALLAPLLLGWASVTLYRHKAGRLSKEAIKKQAKSLVLAGFVTLALISPLIFVTIKNSQQISSSVAALRGNVLYEAKACSNYPYEYAAPFVLHPVFERAVGKDAYIKIVDSIHQGFTCGIGEDTVGISITAMFIVSGGFIIFAWEWLNKRRLKLRLEFDSSVIIVGMILVIVFGVALALPPQKVFGVVPTPAYLLLKITPTWRTLTRLYVVVNFAVIVLLAVVINFFATHFKKDKRSKKIFILILGLIFFSIFVEYLAFKPFTGNKLSTFSYKKDVPSAYTWLSQQDDIKTIAEYPLERAGGESNAMAYYMSMQPVHKKKLFNGSIPTAYEEDLKASLKDISDPQTQAVLHSLGIDTVSIHGVPEDEVSKIPGLKVIHSTSQEKFNLLAYTPLVKKDNMVIVKLVNQPTVDSMLKLESGFVRNTNIIKSSVDWEYESVNNSQFKVSPLPGKAYDMVNNQKASQQCFSVKIAGVGGESSKLILVVDGKEQTGIPLSTDYQRISIKAKGSIVLRNEAGFNMRIKDLGCSNRD
ncbi:MAG: hypothetical protein ABIQ89_02410 [Candidatus Saccharimonadales bacterium]